MAVVGELGSLTPRSCHSLDSHVRCPLASVSPTVAVPVQVWRPQEQGRSRWLWAGPLFLPMEEVLLAWAAGPPSTGHQCSIGVKRG